MRKGQIWVETVIYTLIGLTLIGVALTLILPKINEYKDRAVVEQSIDAMKVFDTKIKEVADSGAGNIRKIDSFYIKRGKLIFDSESNEIIFLIEGLAKPYSEAGENIEIGATTIRTTGTGKNSKVEIFLNYSSSVNLTFEGSKSQREFSSNSIPYSFILENKGNSENLVSVDLEEVSGK